MGAACGPTDESQAEPRVRHLASLTRLLTRLRGDKQARRPTAVRLPTSSHAFSLQQYGSLLAPMHFSLQQYGSLLAPMPISVSSRHFALRYEVPKFLPRGGHLCMAVLTIAAEGQDTVP